MRRQRSAFTLIELLVVIALIAMLAGLVAFVMPGFRERNRAAKGGQALQGWLNYARQQALLHQAPRGVRLLFTTPLPPFDTNPAMPPIPVVRECQYIERPDDFVGGQLSPDTANHVLPPTMANPWVPTLVRVAGANFADGSVEIGDNLEVLGTGQVHRIVGLQATGAPNVLDELVLASPLPSWTALGSDTSPPTPITHYRIQRKPRVTGEESLKLPNEIIIDGSMVAKYAMYGGFYPSNVFTDPPANTQGYVDLLFGPSGALLESGGDKVIMWVRIEPRMGLPNDEYYGNPTLIVVYANSGAVAAYDPAKGGNPYALIR